MSQPERVYLIKNVSNGALFLVRASSPALALNHLLTEQYEISIPRPLEVADLMEKGHKVLRANGNADALTANLFTGEAHP